MIEPSLRAKHERVGSILGPTWVEITDIKITDLQAWEFTTNYWLHMMANLSYDVWVKVHCCVAFWTFGRKVKEENRTDPLFLGSRKSKQIQYTVLYSWERWVIEE